jgi:hypothetical protein
MYSLIISSVIVPDVTAKYPLAQRCLPQYCFEVREFLEQKARACALEPLYDLADVLVRR